MTVGWENYTQTQHLQQHTQCFHLNIYKEVVKSHPELVRPSEMVVPGSGPLDYMCQIYDNGVALTFIV